MAEAMKWARDPFVGTNARDEDIILMARALESLVEQFDAVVDLMRFRPGMDCWCAFRSVDQDDLHTEACLAVRELLGVSNPAKEPES